MDNAGNSTATPQAQWNQAFQSHNDAEAAYAAYLAKVWDPAYDREQHFETEHGLVSPGSGRDATPNYFDKRRALLKEHPDYALPEDVSEECERLCDVFTEAQSMLMSMEAPDLPALRWKLEHVLQVEGADETSEGSTPCWVGSYVRQAIVDYQRLLPLAA